MIFNPFSCLGISPTSRPSTHIKSTLDILTASGESKTVDCFFLQMERAQEEPASSDGKAPPSSDSPGDSPGASNMWQLMLGTQLSGFGTSLKTLQDSVDGLKLELTALRGEKQLAAVPAAILPLSPMEA